MTSIKNNKNKSSQSPQNPYTTFLYPVLKPVLPKIIQACLVMTLSIILLAAVPLVVNDLKKVLSNVSTTTEENNNNNNNIQSPSDTFTPKSQTNSNKIQSMHSLLQMNSNNPLVAPLFLLDQEDLNIFISGVKLLALILIHSCVSYLGHYLSEKAATASSNALRRAALQATLNLDWSLRLSANDVNASSQASAWLESVAAVHDIIANVITNVFPTVVNCLVTFLALYWQSPMIALTLGSFVLGSFMFLEFSERIKKEKRLRQQQEQQEKRRNAQQQQQPAMNNNSNSP